MNKKLSQVLMKQMVSVVTAVILMITLLLVYVVSNDVRNDKNSLAR